MPEGRPGREAARPRIELVGPRRLELGGERRGIGEVANQDVARNGGHDEGRKAGSVIGANPGMVSCFDERRPTDVLLA